MKKFHFVFITTNLINGKQYVGDHSTNKISDGYLGSGRPYFQNALNEYGKENFKREELEFFNTKKEAFDAQEKYIIKYNTLMPNGYNLSPTGGIRCIGCFSEETTNHFSEIVKGEKNPMFGKSVYSVWLKNFGKEEADKRYKIWKEKISKNTSGENNPFFGKHHTNETKENIRKSKTGKSLSEEHKNNIKNTHLDYKGKNHPNFGKKLKDHKIRKTCPYCNRVITLGNYKRWHGEKCKYKK